MRDRKPWLNAKWTPGIPILLLAIATTGCRSAPPSQPNFDTDKAFPESPATQESQESTEIPTTSLIEPSEPEPNTPLPQASTKQELETLPTLPTVPIASLPELEISTTTSENIESSPTPESVLKGERESQLTNDILTKGTFVSGKTPTQGGVVIVDDEGTPVIQFEQDFQTENGPDLVIVLHREANPLADAQASSYSLIEGDYVEIAPLKANQGQQYYSVPAAIILDNYNSVAIWCRTFNATFGAASLQ